ncbi:MAG TPA: LysR family transcriptional regulator [Gemmatimonadaceae bacterium]
MATPDHGGSFELRHLRAFIAVAEAEHVTRAAERLHIAQPALSRQMRQLEAAVGAALFTRVGRGVRLTPAGRAFLEDARAVLTAVAAAAAHARRVERGTAGVLRIGFVEVASASGLVPEAVRRFAVAHPDVGVDLREMTSGAQIAALRDHALDIGFVCGMAADQARGLRAETVLADPLVAVLSARHPLARMPRIPPAALVGERLLMVRRQLGPTLHADVEAVFARAGAPMELVQEVSQMQTVVHLAAAGVGIGIVPLSVAASARSDAVVKPVIGLSARHRTQLVVPADRRSIAADGFAAACKRAAVELRRQGAHPSRDGTIRSAPPAPARTPSRS